MNKILLIPGSFNPITNAHVDMALAAKRQSMLISYTLSRRTIHMSQRRKH